MIPLGTLRGTIQQKETHVFLTEAHAFGGNSGSPVFIDTNKFTGTLGYNYKLLGVISGEVFENADLTLSVTTTITGNVGANSDVSVVVPAMELTKLLNISAFKEFRESGVKQALSQKPANASGSPQPPKNQ